MDPALTMPLPDYQTCAGCSDILMHTMERYFTNGSKLEITDALAEGLLRTVMQFAAVLHKDPLNYQARAEIMWAGSLSHNGLTGCGNDGNDFASHRLEHELGALYGVTHGAGLTAVWPSWARYVYKNCLPRFVKFAVNVMGVAPGASDEETALQGIAAMEDYFRSIGMPVTIRELLGKEITEEEIALLAKNCALATGGKVGSAMVLYEADMGNIFRMAK
jgi:alcohol dehydrogenase YqhD (iron-dependent ADH family)